MDLAFNKQEFLQNKKIATVEAPKDHYHADAAIVWCFDDRFSGVLQKFLETKGFKHKDLICIAGGLKSLASPTSEDNREFVLDQIKGSIALHDTKVVYLMLHSDCGKYGGLRAFDNDENRELEHYRLEAKKAEEYLKAHLPPEILTESVFVDFDGVYQFL